MKKFLIVCLAILMTGVCYAASVHSPDMSTEYVINDIWYNDVKPGSAVKIGLKIMDITAWDLTCGLQISDDTSTYRKLIIAALPTNTSDVYLMPAGEINNATCGSWILRPTTDAVVLDYASINLLSFDAVKANNGVMWIGIKK